MAIFGCGTKDAQGHVSLPAVTPPPMQAQPAPAVDPWWVTKAKAEIGEARVPGAANNPRIVFYESFTTLKVTDDSVPWCSAFMCYIFGGGTRSASAISWATWGTACSFRPGCIVVFSRAGGHHVAIGLEDHGATVSVLGGNQGPDSVVCIEPKFKKDIVALRWPG